MIFCADALAVFLLTVFVMLWIQLFFHLSRYVFFSLSLSLYLYLSLALSLALSIFQTHTYTHKNTPLISNYHSLHTNKQTLSIYSYAVNHSLSHFRTHTHAQIERGSWLWRSHPFKVIVDSITKLTSPQSLKHLSTILAVPLPYIEKKFEAIVDMMVWFDIWIWYLNILYLLKGTHTTFLFYVHVLMHAKIAINSVCVCMYQFWKQNF